jgi:hypothetical protein
MNVAARSKEGSNVLRGIRKPHILKLLRCEDEIGSVIYLMDAARNDAHTCNWTWKRSSGERVSVGAAEDPGPRPAPQLPRPPAPIPPKPPRPPAPPN